MRELNGAEVADYMKLNQQHKAAALKTQGIRPKLVILRDSDNPVIEKYVSLKREYGEDIGIEVEDVLTNDLAETIAQLNQDKSVSAVIVQLPLRDPGQIDQVVGSIAPEKDVDGLSHAEDGFESATATAINWLLSGYDIDLKNKRVAIVGHGRLVGAPLEKMWRASNYDVTVFDKGDDLDELKYYDIVVTATGVPRLISDDMIKPGAVVVDAGTASEDGVLVGDIDDTVRKRSDLKAITPKVGGVGPLTVAALFEHVLMAAEKGGD